MKSVQELRDPSKLSEPILQQLNLYALAAGAAGAGFLAISQPLRAEVVFTPTHVRLANGQVPIDLNNDGTADFFLINHSKGGSCCLYSRTLSVAGGYVGGIQNGVIGVALWANALKAGQAIGPRQQFGYAHFKMANAFNDSNSFFFINGPSQHDKSLPRSAFQGEWRDALRLGAVQYRESWIRRRRPSGCGNPDRLRLSSMPTRQSSPVKRRPIGRLGESIALQASHTASLGLLALGAPGLDIWRRDNPRHTP